MLAIKRLRGEQLVAGITQMVGHNRLGFGGHIDLSGDPINMGLRHGTVDDREGLRDDELMRNRQQIVEKARSCQRRIFSNRDHRAKTRVVFRRASNFQSVSPEREAFKGHRFVKRHPGQVHWSRNSAVHQLHEEF